MSDERRASPRVEANLPGEIETEQGKTSIAISRDISPGGLLLFTRLQLDAGSRITLKVAHDGEALPLACTVVRVDELPVGASVLWRWQVAVKLEGEDAALARIYAALVPDRS
jgi:hypothetical protein